MSASMQFLSPHEAIPASGAKTAPRAGTGTSDLGAAPLGFRGRILALRPTPGVLLGSLPAAELERRLVELGFVEGAVVELLHEGLIGRDPIAVRVDGVTIALRRKEAAAVLVEALG